MASETVTQDDVDKAAANVAAQREELALLRLDETAGHQAKANESVLVQLAEESAVLDAEIAAVKERTGKTTVTPFAPPVPSEVSTQPVLPSVPPTGEVV